MPSVSRRNWASIVAPRYRAVEEERVQHFRQRLLAMQSELQALDESSTDAGATVVLDQSKVGRLSRMDAMQAQQMAQETARRRKIQLQRIDSALKRIESGDNGYCFICGEDIGEARLDFDPASTRCVGCMDE